MKRGFASLVATLAVGVLIGFMLGIWVGSASLDFDDDRAAPRAAAPKSSIFEPRPHALPKPFEPARIIADTTPEKKEAEPFLGFEGFGELGNWNATEKIASLAISAMSDEKLTSALVSMTSLTEDQLDDISDLTGYTNRLTEIAMSGLLTDPLEMDDSIGPVEFATDADVTSGPENPQTRFTSDEEKIYAVFTTENYGESHVFVHWYRVTNPKLLLMEQYRINYRDPYSFVWLEERKGWEEGEYRVEVYSDTEDLSPIAHGSFIVVKGGY